MKLALASVALFGSAAAFSPAFAPRTSGTALFNGPAKGAGGMFDTRDPAAFQHEDPRKSIGEAPSFEEYLKQRGNGPAAPAAAAPAAAQPPRPQPLRSPLPPLPPQPLWRRRRRIPWPCPLPGRSTTTRAQIPFPPSPPATPRSTKSGRTSRPRRPAGRSAKQKIPL